MVLPSPTIHTLVALVPHTPRSGTMVPLVDLDQVVPFQCWIEPLSPTAQTSSMLEPHTPRNV